jgi:hypothetical protein
MIAEVPGGIVVDSIEQLRERQRIIVGERFVGLPESQQDGQPRLVADASERLDHMWACDASGPLER